VSKSSPKQSAFSLLEVVIAVGILSAGITVVMQALTFCARASGLSSDYIQAVLLVNDKLQECELKERQSAGQYDPREESGSSGKFNWHYIIEDLATVKLYRLDLEVSWQRRKRKDSLQVSTYLR
jgi:Tfp pilus assembly protein PilV